ncbi:MAG TPA: enoyl-CoA hydratase [Acidimicrobiales bacterium]|jgi:enoyl-CoA hydratase/carnithine racemase|nr:enoyl-CoA hydratase [Acidimicrobiales bacterium]
MAQSSSFETVIVDRTDGVVTLTLNRPEKKNAANDQMWSDLKTVFEDVARRDDDRVLVITGAGGAFCSGADLSSPNALAENGLARMRRIGSTALALHRLSKPTIAKVGGVAAGAGCNLALGCDLVVASDDARFSEIFAKRGLSLDFGGSWLLPRLVGLHKAKELAFFADVISAQEAERLGIVNRVVPAAELDGFVDDWARRLAAGPPMALSMTKTMLNNSFMVSMDQALEDEARSQNVNFGTKDFQEAIAAFLQKREPRFEGH